MKSCMMPVMKRLAADAVHWDQQGRPDDLTYGERRLRDAQSWVERNMSSQLETDFIVAGTTRARQQAEAERERQQRELELAQKAERNARRAGQAEREAREAAEHKAMRALWAAWLAGILMLLAIAITVIAGISLQVSRQETQQLAEASIFFDLEYNRSSTLQAGGVGVPLGTQTPGIFEPTLTAIASLNVHDPNLPGNQETDGFGITMVRVPAGCFFNGQQL